MTKRSFFRYFPTKEDVVFDGIDLTGEEVVAGIAARRRTKILGTPCIRSYGPGRKRSMQVSRYSKPCDSSQPHPHWSGGSTNAERNGVDE